MLASNSLKGDHQAQLLRHFYCVICFFFNLRLNYLMIETSESTRVV